PARKPTPPPATPPARPPDAHVRDRVEAGPEAAVEGRPPPDQDEPGKPGDRGREELRDPPPPPPDDEPQAERQPEEQAHVGACRSHADTHHHDAAQEPRPLLRDRRGDSAEPEGD